MWLSVADTCIVFLKTTDDYMCKFQMFRIGRDLIIYNNSLLPEKYNLSPKSYIFFPMYNRKVEKWSLISLRSKMSGETSSKHSKFSFFCIDRTHVL